MKQIPTHNGYTNRETELVDIWLNNEISMYEPLTRIADSKIELHEKCDELKQFVYTLCNETTADLDSEINGVGSSLVCDLVTNSLSNVNYREIILSVMDSLGYVID